jgi:hypothetical protein
MAMMANADAITPKIKTFINEKPRDLLQKFGERVMKFYSSLKTNQWKRPIRLTSRKLIQIKKAFPTMFSSGTNPQKRESVELSRLSPITK